MTTRGKVPEHETHVLSDLGRSIWELGEMVMRKEERRELSEWVGRGTVRGMCEFWGVDDVDDDGGDDGQAREDRGGRGVGGEEEFNGDEIYYQDG